MLMHFVENYIDQFEDVDYVKTFKGLKQRYEQQIDRQTGRSMCPASYKKALVKFCH